LLDAFNRLFWGDAQERRRLGTVASVVTNTRWLLCSKITTQRWYPPHRAVLHFMTSVRRAVNKQSKSPAYGGLASPWCLRVLLSGLHCRCPCVQPAPTWQSLVIVKGGTVRRAYCADYIIVGRRRMLQHVAVRLENVRWTTELLEGGVRVRGSRALVGSCRPCVQGLDVSFRYGRD